MIARSAVRKTEVGAWFLAAYCRIDIRTRFLNTRVGVPTTETGHGGRLAVLLLEIWAAFMIAGAALRRTEVRDWFMVAYRPIDIRTGFLRALAATTLPLTETRHGGRRAILLFLQSCAAFMTAHTACNVSIQQTEV